MRIAQVVPAVKLGGMQAVVDLLAALLPARGVECSLIELDKVPSTIGYRSARGTALKWLRLTRLLRRPEFDAVISHAPRTAAFSSTAAFIGGVARRIVVQHTSILGTSRLDRALLYVLTSIGIITDVVFVGQAVRESFSRAPRCFLRRSSVIRNGVLPRVHTHRPATSAARRALVVSRLVPSKNIEVAIAACASAKPGVELVIAGDGPQRDHLVRYSRLLDASVRFLGACPPEALATLYPACSIVLFPTRHEGLPLALLEAASAGVPVIASDIPPNREVMGDAAVYCAADDVAAWANSIEELLDDPDRCRQLALAGLRRLGDFDANAMVDRYASLLRSDAG